MNKPSVSQLLAATGVTDITSPIVSAAMGQAVSVLYGRIGANLDQRNWDQILSSGNPLQAADTALKTMFQSADYLIDNAEYLRDKGVSRNQIELSIRQSYDRLSLDYSPEWATGTWMARTSQKTDQELKGLPPAPDVAVDFGASGISLTLEEAGEVRLSETGKLTDLTEGTSGLSSQPEVAQGFVTLTSAATRQTSAATREYIAIGTDGNDEIDLSDTGSLVHYVFTGNGDDVLTVPGGDATTKVMAGTNALIIRLAPDETEGLVSLINATQFRLNTLTLEVSDGQELTVSDIQVGTHVGLYALGDKLVTSGEGAVVIERFTADGEANAEICTAGPFVIEVGADNGTTLQDASTLGWEGSNSVLSLEGNRGLQMGSDESTALTWDATQANNATLSTIDLTGQVDAHLKVDYGMLANARLGAGDENYTLYREGSGVFNFKVNTIDNGAVTVEGLSTDTTDPDVFLFTDFTWDLDVSASITADFDDSGSNTTASSFQEALAELEDGGSFVLGNDELNFARTGEDVVITDGGGGEFVGEITLVGVGGTLSDGNFEFPALT